MSKRFLISTKGEYIPVEPKTNTSADVLEVDTYGCDNGEWFKIVTNGDVIGWRRLKITDVPKEYLMLVLVMT